MNGILDLDAQEWEDLEDEKKKGLGSQAWGQIVDFGQLLTKKSTINQSQQLTKVNCSSKVCFIV